MVPVGRVALLAKAAFVIEPVNGPAAWSRNLAAKRSGGERVAQSRDKRAKPIGALRSGVCVEEDAVFGLRQVHRAIHHAARIVVLGFDLDEVAWFCLANQVDRSVGGAGIDDDQLPIAIFLSG